MPFSGLFGGQILPEERFASAAPNVEYIEAGRFGKDLALAVIERWQFNASAQILPDSLNVRCLLALNCFQCPLNPVIVRAAECVDWQPWQAGGSIYQ